MNLRAQFERMSPREQRLLMLLGLVFGLLAVVGMPAYFYVDLMAARDRNEEIRQLLTRMNQASELLATRKREREAMELRYARPAPALAAFIENAAKANGLDVPESNDQPEVKGKDHVERVTVVKMRQVNLKPFVKMLEKIERSGHPVAITQLSIKARASAPDSYDVKLAVSAYDKKAAEAPGSGKGSSKSGSKSGESKGRSKTPSKGSSKGQGEEL